jgi:hypothetical protein
MKVSDLIRQSIEYLIAKGDKEVLISILTENGNYEFKPCSSCCDYKDSFQIEMDVKDVRAFKKIIK